MSKVFIGATGLYTPSESISNQELVSSFNQYVDAYNRRHAEAIESGSMSPMKHSDENFIEKASGIKNRYVMDKAGILDVEVMQPKLEKREDNQLSIQAQMGKLASEEALSKAGYDASTVDLVIVACSNMQRAYPAVAIELQAALGTSGFAYDMNVACSSATFGIQAAYAAIKAGTATRALVVSPEICTAHLNFTDRDSHFIFGDACTAVIIESGEKSTFDGAFEILDTKMMTQFSNNIRNNFGFLTKTDPGVLEAPEEIFSATNMFMQQGRRVFKDIIPMVSDLISDHLKENQIEISQLKRMWLHQANANINRLVVERLLGDQASTDDSFSPSILDEYANTSSPGCVIAFHQYRDDLAAGDIALLCSFGAGYSIGNLILQRV